MLKLAIILLFSRSTQKQPKLLATPSTAVENFDLNINAFAQAQLNDKKVIAFSGGNS